MVDPLARGFDALQIALGIVFLLGGAPKLLGTERMRAMFDHLRVPQALRIIAGFIELGAGLGLLLGVLMQPWIGTAAAISASPLMFGTMMTNITRSRRRDAWLMSALVLFLCVLVAYVRSSAAGAVAQR